MPPKLTPPILSAALTGAAGILHTACVFAKTNESSQERLGPMASNLAKSNLHLICPTKTSELVGQPQRVAQIVTRLNTAPDHAVFGRSVFDKYTSEDLPATLYVAKPYDQIQQPSVYSLCLNAAYLKEKSGIDIFVPYFDTVNESAVTFSSSGALNVPKDNTDLIADHLLQQLTDKESIAVLVPQFRGKASELSHLSALVFQKQGDAVFCILYDGVMEVYEPALELLDSLANTSGVEQLNLFIPEGKSQSDHFSCRTKSFVESTVALRFPEPMKNVGEARNLSQEYMDQNPLLNDLAESNPQIQIRSFTRALYPDKTSQRTGYQKLHPKVNNKPIAANRKTLMTDHIDQYKQAVLLGGKPRALDEKIAPNQISFEKEVHSYLKLKGYQLTARAREIDTSIKKAHGAQYKKVLAQIVEHHSLGTTSADAVLKEPKPEKNTLCPWVSLRK